MELGELWLGVMGMVLLGVLLDNMFDFMVAVLPVVGMLACVFSSGLTAVGFTGWNQRQETTVYINLSIAHIDHCVRILSRDAKVIKTKYIFRFQENKTR